MPEDQKIEWKENWRDEYLRWISAFANTKGGKLVIGKNDKGVITGLADTKKLLEDIPNKVRDILGIMVDVNLHRKKKLEYLEIVVDAYPYPVSYKGEYHVRVGSTKQELKGAALDKFLLSKQGKHWDGVPVPTVAIRDLSPSALDAFRKRALQSKRLNKRTLPVSNTALIEKLHLRDGKYLKRAAVLLFYPEPEKYVTGASVKIAYFKNNHDILYMDEIRGDLFTQVDKTIDLLLTKYLRAGITVEGVQRVETLPVPEAALREAVLNAIVHKDYSSGTPIQVSVYSTKLRIWNTGKLPPDWTVKKLETKHASLPFNPSVANVFFDAGMIEAWGRGIELIFAECKAAGLQEPILCYEPSELWIEFFFPKATAPATAPRLFHKILEFLLLNPTASRQEVADALGGLSLSGVKYHLNKLKSTGHLRRVGPNHGGKWVVSKSGQ